MRCTVYNKKRRTVALAVFLAILSAAILTAPRILTAYGVYGYALPCRALGVVAIAAFIYVMARHIALSFVYAIVLRDDTAELDFTVARLRGESAQVAECVMPMRDLVLASKFGDGVTRRSIRKKLDGAVSFYDYSVTMGGDDFVLVFEDGEGYAAIIIEPSDEMRDYFAAYAGDLKKRRDT